MQQEQTTSALNVGFLLSGAFITEMARERMANNEPQRALRFLRESLEGLSADQAVGILRGTHKLTGDSRGGIDITEEDGDDPELKRYLEALSSKWRGVFRYENRTYRPCAQVTAWNADDYHYSLKVAAGSAPIPHTAGSREEYKLNRSAYYADDAANDLVVGTENGIFLCKHLAEEPPFWVEVRSRDAERHLLEFVEKYPLPERGADLSSTPFSELSLSLKADPPQLDAPRVGSDENLEAILEDEAEQWGAKCRRIGEAVRLQATAGEGFLDLIVNLDEEGKKTRLVKVPKAPFMRWVYRGIDAPRYGIDLPVWTQVSEPGMKMRGDDPYHTDWMLGAGLDLEEGYTSPEMEAAWDLLHELRTTALQSDCVVLAGEGLASGRAIFPKPNEPVPQGSIAIVPHAGPEYQLAMESACAKGEGAIICETGGRLAHLAVVGREMAARVVMQKGALTRYLPGELLMVDCTNRQVATHGDVF